SSQKKCDKNNTIQVKISNTIQVKMKLNKNTDSDIMEWLEGQPSKAQSRAPLENHKISSEKQKKR
ncbi:MAG: hypothetical protein RR472_02520, partial [Anaerovoracaceae bacterium]